MLLKGGNSMKKILVSFIVGVFIFTGFSTNLVKANENETVPEQLNEGDLTLEQQREYEDLGIKPMSDSDYEKALAESEKAMEFYNELIEDGLIKPEQIDSTGIDEGVMQVESIRPLLKTTAIGNGGTSRLEWRKTGGEWWVKITTSVAFEFVGTVALYKNGKKLSSMPVRGPGIGGTNAHGYAYFAKPKGVKAGEWITVTLFGAAWGVKGNLRVSKYTIKNKYLMSGGPWGKSSY